MDSPPASFDEAARLLHLEQARRRFAGPDYYEVLGWIHDELRPRTYIEIGVGDGSSLARCRPETRALGVDPAPRLEGAPAARTQLFRCASDEFFASHLTPQALGASTFDLAFIDGLHLFEQALLDFINLERWAGPDSVVLIHDCLSLDAVTASRTRTTAFYTGDVWKVPLCLRDARPDLKIAIVETAPSGLAVITRLDASSRRLEEALPDLRSSYASLGLEEHRLGPRQREETIPNREDAVRAHLRAERRARS